MTDKPGNKTASSNAQSFIGRWEKLMALGLLLAAAFVVYYPSLSGTFVFDDYKAVVDNKVVTEGQWSQLFTTNWWNKDSIRTFRPLSTISLMIEVSLAGLDPFWIRLNNIILHALSAWILFLLARRQFKIVPAMIAGLAFALHPVMVENVSPAVGRAELLCALFSFTTILVTLSNRLRNFPQAILTGIFYLLAVLSKENGLTVMAPAILIILAQRKNEGGTKSTLRWKIAPFLIVAVLYLAYQFAIFGPVERPDVPRVDNLLHGLPRFEAWWTALGLQWNYLWNLTGFATARVDYTYNAVELPAWWAGALFLPILAAYAWLTWIVWKKRPQRTWILFWYPATLSLSSNLTILTYCIFAPRLLHLPLAALALGLAWMVEWLGPKFVTRSLVAILTVCLIAVWGIIGHARTKEWKDEATLFSADVLRGTASLRVEAALGLWFSEHGMHDAVQDNCHSILPKVDKALESGIDWTSVDRQVLGFCYYQCGNSLMKMERYKQALLHYQKAFAIEPHPLFTERINRVQKLMDVNDENQGKNKGSRPPDNVQ